LTFSKLLTMFMVVSKFGETNQMFVDAGVEIDGAMSYCHDVLLIEQLYCLSCVRFLASSLASSKTATVFSVACICNFVCYHRYRKTIVAFFVKLRE